MESASPPLAAVLGTFAVNAGLAWMTGCIVLLAWSRGRHDAAGNVRERAFDHATRGLARAGLGTAVALAFDLWRRAAEAAEVPLFAAGAAVRTMLVATHYGHAWTWGMAAVVALAVLARARDTRAARVAAIVALGVHVYTRSIVGHAGSDGDRSLAVAVDAFHLVVVSLWTGVVWTSAVSMHAAGDDATDTKSWLRVLSATATIALAVIVATGLLNAWRVVVGSLSATWDSTYGATLVAKIAFVLGAAGLGGINRWVHLPRLLAGGDPAAQARRAFMVVLRIEAGVLAIVLMLAAVLTNLEPPGSM